MGPILVSDIHYSSSIVSARVHSIACTNLKLQLPEAQSSKVTPFLKFNPTLNLQSWSYTCLDLHT